MFKGLIELYLKQPSYRMLGKKVKLKIFQIFTFQCHYLKIGGRKYAGYFKKMKTACQTYMKTKKVC